MKNNSYKDILKIINKAHSIAVFTHINPDFDALGSSLSLVTYCRNLNKTAFLYTKNEFLDNQKLIFDNLKARHIDCDFDKFDLVISVDAPSVARLGDYGEGFMKQPNSIVLDHHFNQGLLGRYNYIDKEMSSCAEIVFEILKYNKKNITKEIATYLYAGLSSDTHSFINSNVNEESFKHAYELVKFNADINDVNNKQFKFKTQKEIDFEKYLLDNMNIVKDCAYCVIDNNTLNKMNGKKSDCDFFSSKLITIQNINYGFSIIEDENGILNISMRSMTGYDVKRVAEKFGGGGHLCAAGAKTSDYKIKELIEIILNYIFESKDEENAN